MRIHALLNWYDEPCSALAATVTSLKHAHVDHVIALDGAYFLFPDGKPNSPPDQAATIHQTARTLGIACTIHTPNEKWIGNEVEKRTALFTVANALSQPGDWWFVIDADVVVTKAPHDLKHQLEQTEHDAARGTVTEVRNLDQHAEQARQFNWTRDTNYPLRMLFRAQPIRCHTNHYTYITHDNRILWCSDSGTQEPCIDINNLHVEHREAQRDLNRRQTKTAYYHRRDELGVENGPCAWDTCTELGTVQVARNFRLSMSDEKGYVADLVKACPKHAKRIEHENYWTLKSFGIDADTAERQIREGAAA